VIKAILFDSGKVLNYPATGHWFISPHFYEVVDKDIFQKINSKKVQYAFQSANQYMDSIKSIQDKEQELIHFTKFYSIFSDCLPALKLSKAKINFLAEDLVYTPTKYTFYEDVFSVIPVLKETYQLGIVSDAWPSLLDVYEHAGLKKYFSTIIISSVLGTQKPDKRMYEAALESLCVNPQEAIFIDDSIQNCVGAAKVGIKPYLLCREHKTKLLPTLYTKWKGIQIIPSLNPLLNL